MIFGSGRQQFNAREVFLRDRWSTATLVTNYMPIILFPVLYGVAKIVTWAPLVKAGKMDLYSGIAEIEAIT
jgi:amino acid transporter